MSYTPLIPTGRRTRFLTLTNFPKNRKQKIDFSFPFSQYEQNKNILWRRWGRRSAEGGESMTESNPPRRKPPKIDSERAEAIRACDGHLRDLRRAHVRPPADVRVCMTRIPRFIAPVPTSSYCTSPALLCAELVR
jgi:hypothetical protein